jgi:hypothetical protein
MPMPRYNPGTAHIRIISHNVNRSSTVLNTLLNTAGKTTDIILVQEANIKDPRYATTHPNFLLLLPPCGAHSANRTAAYISHHNPHLQVTPRPDVYEDPNIQVLEIGTALIPPLYILNVYNEKEPSSQLYTIPRSLAQLILPQYCIITGDLNAHHPLWNSRVRHPTRADELIMLIEEQGWHLVNVPDTPTHSFRKGTGSSVLDLTIAAPSVAREVSNWAIDEENQTGSDHEVVTFQITSLHPDADFMSPEPHLNWKKTDWDTFTSTLQNLSTKKHPLWSSLHENPTQHNLDEWATLLHDIILSAAVTSTPLLLPSPRSKRWWTAEIEHTHMAMSRARQTWQRMHLPHHHVDYCSLRNEHFRRIRYAKDSLWKEYLSQAVTPYNV